jgi:hypothetical protein
MGVALMIAVLSAPKSKTGAEGPTPTQEVETAPVTGAPKIERQGIDKAAYDSIPVGSTKAFAIATLGEPDSKSESEIPGFGTTELWTWNKFSLVKVRAITLIFQNGFISDKNWTEL